MCHTSVVPVTKTIIQLPNNKITKFLLALCCTRKTPELQLPQAALEMAFHSLEMAFHCLEMEFHCLEMAFLSLIASTAKSGQFYLGGGKKIIKKSFSDLVSWDGSLRFYLPKFGIPNLSSSQFRVIKETVGQNEGIKHHLCFPKPDFKSELSNSLLAGDFP